MVDESDDYEKLGTKDNHLVQRAIINNFGECRTNKQGKKNCSAQVLNFKTRKAESRNTRRIMMKNGINFDDLEESINVKIERPCIKILRKIDSAKDTVCLKRSELNLLKRYLLLQIYRNEANARTYRFGISKESDDDLKKLLKEGETPAQYWQRMMRDIVDNEDPDKIIGLHNEAGACMYGTQMRLMIILRTDSEFFLNDVGTVCENIADLSDDQKRVAYYKMFNMMGSYVSENKLDAIIKSGPYFSNYDVLIISPKTVILSVNPIWKEYSLPSHDYKSELDKLNKIGINSEILRRYALSPAVLYKEFEKIKGYQVPIHTNDDEFIYAVQDLNLDCTRLINYYIFNETQELLCYRTKSEILAFVGGLISLKISCKNDYSWVIPELCKDRIKKVDDMYLIKL